MRKSQTATEYLIILAVVIIIALVAINTLGGFPGIGSNNNKKVADYKLQTGTVGIDSYSIGTNSSLFKLKNNYFETVTVTEFRINQQSNLTCNSSNTVPSLPIVLNIGESKLINCSAINSSNYVITNKQTPMIGISYIDSLGATRTAGNVNSYAAVNSSVNGSQGGQTPAPNSTVLSLRNGLIAYYPFDGNTSDLSGNGNDGVSNGPAYNQSGIVGGAYSFTGGISTGIILNSVINFSSNSTVCFWNKFLTQSYHGPFYNSVLDNYPIIFSQDESWLFLRPLSGQSNVDYDPSLFYTRWGYLCVVQNNTNNQIIYVNGAYLNTLHIAGIIPFNVLIGSDSELIDEVAIWNRSLNSTEISDLYNSGSGLSLSLSGAQAPACAVDQTSCTGTNYLTCSNGNWVNNGDVSGQCDYVTPGNVTQLRQGLVAYYPYDNNTLDNSGNYNDGSNYGATPGASGKVGNAYSFDGSTNYISVPYSSSFNVGTSNFTMSSWVKSYGGQEYTTILEATDVVTGNGFHLALHDSGIYFYSGGGVPQFVGSLNYKDSTWHYVTIVKHADTANAFIDGNLIGSVPAYLDLTFTSDVNLSIGDVGGASRAVWYFDGLIDEVSIWNRSLNSTEILQLYNSGSGLSLYVPPTPANISQLRNNLVGYWTLDGTADDNSSNHLDGNWVGSATYVPGIIGQSAEFHDSEYIDLGNSALLKPAGDFSIQIWAKSSFTDHYMMMFAADGPSQRSFYTVMDNDYNPDYVQMYGFSSSGWYEIDTMGSPSMGMVIGITYFILILMLRKKFMLMEI